LRSAIPRLLRSDWRERPLSADDDISVQLRARYAREIAWRMATEEPEWNATRPVAGILAILAQLIYPRKGVLTADELDAHGRRAVAREAAALSALLPGLGHPGTDSAAFVHAELQHFLVAWKLSEDPASAIDFLQPRWWAYEDWRDVTVLLAGLLPDPAPLLRALDEDGASDAFAIVDQMAVQALAETSLPRPGSLNAMRRVQTMLGTKDDARQWNCATALACLGSDGFTGISWDVLAPWTESRKTAGHKPNAAFTVALRAGAQAASDVLGRMADGQLPFLSWGIPSAHGGYLGEKQDAVILRSQPDWIVLGLARTPRERFAPTGSDYRLLHIAATEAHLRGLPFDEKNFPADLKALIQAGLHDRAKLEMAMRVTSAQSEFERDLLSLDLAEVKHMPNDQLRDMTEDSALPVRLREASLLALIHSDLALALTAAPVLVPDLPDTSEVFIQLAGSGCDESLIRSPVTRAARSRLRAAVTLFKLDPERGLQAYLGLAATEADEKHQPCPHDVLHAMGRDLRDLSPSLWLDAIIRWTPCMWTDVDDYEDLAPVIAGADQETRRTIALTAAYDMIRRLAVETLPAASNREILRRIVHESNGREINSALRLLGTDEFATDYLTCIVTNHLLHCPGFRHGLMQGCELELSWVWKLSAAAQIPGDVLRQWRAHTDDYMAAAVAGDAAALAELRRRRDDCQTTSWPHGCEDTLRRALLPRAKAGDEAALAELEQEVIGSFTAKPAPRSPHAWTHALAEISPDRARALLMEATRGKPSPVWMVETLAQLGHGPSTERLITNFTANRGRKPSLVTRPADWLARTHPELAAASFLTSLRAICNHMLANDDLDGEAASLGLAFLSSRRLLNPQDVSLVRTCLAARADHIRETLMEARTK
jgi:hypothetical protein